MDLNKPCRCPDCNNPMDLMVPIWVTPGNEIIDTGKIDWESGTRKDCKNWYCEACNHHKLPIEN